MDILDSSCDEKKFFLRYTVTKHSQKVPVSETVKELFSVRSKNYLQKQCSEDVKLE